MVNKLREEGIFSRTGRVKWYNALKGYGFIETDREDLFFHIRDYSDPAGPAAGERVAYDVEARPGGRPQAARVRPIGRPAMNDEAGEGIGPQAGGYISGRT